MSRNPQHPLLSSLGKEKLSLEIESKRKFSMAKKKRRFRRIQMKRRPRLDPSNAIEKKVRILKKLVPNCESMGVERLFRETADYIVALQMRVKVMQIWVNVLSAGSDLDE